MFDENENPFQETKAAFTCAVLLFNFLILASLFGFVWLLRFVNLPYSALSAALSEAVWR